MKNYDYPLVPLVPLETETPKQKQFREDMEAAMIPLRTYSGRGMYGRETYGVDCDGTEVHEQDVYRATALRLQQDSMGRGTILYI